MDGGQRQAASNHYRSISVLPRTKYNASQADAAASINAHVD